MSRSLERIPIIPIWDLLLVPLQGEIEDDMASRMSQDVLETIYRSETRGLIVDVTGLWLMDSHMCAVLSRLAAAASLMGVKTVLCGLTAEIAVTLQSMRLDLEGVTTVPTLEEAFQELGVELVERGQPLDDPDPLATAVQADAAESPTINHRRSTSHDVPDRS